MTISYTEDYIRQCESRFENPNKGFVEFMDNVENFVERALGVRLLDLPDEDYRPMYDDGKFSELQTADFVIRNYENFI